MEAGEKNKMDQNQNHWRETQCLFYAAGKWASGWTAERVNYGGIRGMYNLYMHTLAFVLMLKLIPFEPISVPELYDSISGSVSTRASKAGISKE